MHDVCLTGTDYLEEEEHGVASNKEHVKAGAVC